MGVDQSGRHRNERERFCHRLAVHPQAPCRVGTAPLGEGAVAEANPPPSVTGHVGIMCGHDDRHGVLPCLQLDEQRHHVLRGSPSRGCRSRLRRRSSPRGRFASARAIATRLLLTTRQPRGQMAERGWPRADASRRALPSARRRMRLRVATSGTAAIPTFSAAESVGIRLNCWNTKPISGTSDARQDLASDAAPQLPVPRSGSSPPWAVSSAPRS